jgi:hypothetical protein
MAKLTWNQYLSSVVNQFSAIGRLELATARTVVIQHIDIVKDEYAKDHLPYTAAKVLKATLIGGRR